MDDLDARIEAEVREAARLPPSSPPPPGKKSHWGKTILVTAAVLAVLWAAATFAGDDGGEEAGVVKITRYENDDFEDLVTCVYAYGPPTAYGPSWNTQDDPVCWTSEGRKEHRISREVSCYDDLDYVEVVFLYEDGTPYTSDTFPADCGGTYKVSLTASGIVSLTPR